MRHELTATLATLLCAAALFPIGAAHAAKKVKTETKWDVNAPPLPTRDVSIKVDEGTWMSVDVSPDGQTIAFDLLGDIYTMPLSGGAATRIAKGLTFEVQPRFSPDGKRIAFTSDRGGGDNIWIMNVDGSDKRQVTNEKFRLLNNPTWSADGRFIAAKKHFTTQRSAGTGEIWLYHVSGGKGVPLVKRPNKSHQKELGEPMFSGSGDAIYYVKNNTAGGQFIYAQDSNGELFVIDRYDMATGEIETVVSGAGGSVRPTPSPDGKYMAFVRRERTKSKLYLRDMATGEERKIYDDLDQDMQETWAVYGVYPGMDWTPDSRNIIFWAGGKIRKLDVASGQNSVIEFSVNDTRKVIDPKRPQVAVAPDSFTSTVPKFGTVSPNGQSIVFESLGKLFIMPAAGGAAKRLTNGQGDGRELFPSWSYDGQKITFVDWNDETLGSLNIVSANGGDASQVVPNKAHFRRPRFSPDGTKLVYEVGSGGYLTEKASPLARGVYLSNISDATSERILKRGSKPHFGKDNDRIYYSASKNSALKLESVNLYGKDVRTHASGALVNEYQVSPNGNYIGFKQNYAAFVMPFLKSNVVLNAGAKGSVVPVAKVSDGGATYLNWSSYGTRLNWSLGANLYGADARSALPLLPHKKGEKKSFSAPKKGVSLARRIAADKPTGTVALVGARVITMSQKDGGVIENATVIVKDNRILSVGPSSSVTVPVGAKTLNVQGKTIIPGLIDAHGHGPQGVSDIVPQQNWSAIAHLALGVTTLHDPSNRATQIFAASEFQRAGQFLAPRLFSSGEIVYGAKSPRVFASIDNIDDARKHVRRLKAQGAHSIKNYNQPRRDQRQMVVAAGIEENISVVAEGGAQYYMDMSIIADGNTTLEHNIPQAVLYNDVIDYFAATKVGYTPTLVVTYGGPAGDPYWRATTDVWKHPILSKHVPPFKLQSSSVRRTKAPESDYVDGVSAAQAKKLAERGVLVSIGGHGQEEGLASHWELWSFVKGGMSPVQALAAGTISSAKSLGFDKDIGSLEKGKLADLVILDANPLEDIRNSDKISHIMLNGRLYNSATMNEELTGNSERKPYFWEK